MADLMKYLPSYYEDVTEFIEITDTENPEIDELWDSIYQVRNNQFIRLADENRVRQWEKILNIRPDYVNQSLDYRKAVVIMRLSTRAPLTHRWLEEKTAEIVGTGNFIITFDYDNYWLRIRLSNDKLGLINEYRTYLRRIIPANLGLILEELFKTWGEVLNKYYRYWGLHVFFYSWQEKSELLWQEPEKAPSWYYFVDKGGGGGVLTTEAWWRRYLWKWSRAKEGSWSEFFTLNTWFDVKNYVWE